MNDLLKVLDMSSHQQCVWLYEYFKSEYYQTNDWPCWHGICDTLINGESCEIRCCLADLAFRLRDEAVENRYSLYADKAIELVAMHSARALTGYDKPAFDEWIAYEAQPIHWIIAALIAKEKK